MSFDHLFIRVFIFFILLSFMVLSHCELKAIVGYSNKDFLVNRAILHEHACTHIIRDFTAVFNKSTVT